MPDDPLDPDDRTRMEEVGYFLRVGMKEMLSAVIATNLDISAKLDALLESHVALRALLGADADDVYNELNEAAQAHHRDRVRDLLEVYGQLPPELVEILRRDPPRSGESEP